MVEDDETRGSGGQPCCKQLHTRVRYGEWCHWFKSMLEDGEVAIDGGVVAEDGWQRVAGDVLCSEIDWE